MSNKGDYKRKILKTKLLNYVIAFTEDFNKVHPDTKAKFRLDSEEYLLDDYLFTFVEDVTDIRKAYEADDTGKTLDKLWNGSYNYKIEENE